MANAGKIKGTIPYRGFHIGYPGSGKTGALVSLANAGYKIRMLDFEGNLQPLLNFVDERALPNIDIVTCQDKMRNGDYVGVNGIPQAFNQACKMLIEWKYTDDDGTEVNLGKSTDWGNDTILAVDSMTSLALAIKNRAMVACNKTPSTMSTAVWLRAVSDFENFMDLLKEERKRYHLIVNCHKQILGPSDFLAQGDDDEVKEEKLKMIKDGMIPPRIYPISITKPNAQKVHGALPTMLEFEKTTFQGKDVRIIKTTSGPEIDIKVPGKNLKKQYPIETGLAEIFEALGYKAPGF